MIWRSDGPAFTAHVWVMEDGEYASTLCSALRLHEDQVPPRAEAPKHCTNCMKTIEARRERALKGRAA